MLRKSLVDLFLLIFLYASEFIYNLFMLLYFFSFNLHIAEAQLEMYRKKIIYLDVVGII